MNGPFGFNMMVTNINQPLFNDVWGGTFMTNVLYMYESLQVLGFEQPGPAWLLETIVQELPPKKVNHSIYYSKHLSLT